MSLQLQRGRGNHAAGNMTQQNAVRITQGRERESEIRQKEKDLALPRPQSCSSHYTDLGFRAPLF